MTSIDLNLFVQDVQEMRLAQRAFFAQRSAQNLRVTKLLEAEVDRQLRVLEGAEDANWVRIQDRGHE